MNGSASEELPTSDRDVDVLELAASALQEPIPAIVPEHGLAPSRIALGARLFFDVRLSADRSVSCASFSISA